MNGGDASSSSSFARPNAIPASRTRPPRVPTAALSDSARAISVAFADGVRVQFASDMTLSAQMRFGNFDGQRVTLTCSLNPARARLSNIPANNVALDLEQIVDDWVPSAGDTLSLTWDAREQLWRETSRAVLS